MASNISEEKLEILKKDIQLLYEQRELLSLFSSKGIVALVIGDSLTALSYPNPLSRELSDIDLLLYDDCFEEAVSLCHQNGYLSFKLSVDDGSCAHFIKNGTTIHLLSEMKVFGDDLKDELLNTWIASAEPLIARIRNDTFLTLQQWLNGILQLAILQTETRRGRVKMQSLIDWMMFAKGYLCDENWSFFGEKADRVGLKEFAKSITHYGKRYVDINESWCEEASEIPDNFVVLDIKKVHFNNESLKTCGLVRKFKLVFRAIFRFIKQSPLRSILYYLNDLIFIIVSRMQGKPKIRKEDVRAVEENVTFIFKSFNRQRQAKRLYSNIKEYYPNADVIVADDSENPLNFPGVINLPFNSGLSRGLQAALAEVKTPYVVRLDDDMLLTPKTNVHEELRFLKEHPEVDLVAVMADYRRPNEYAHNFESIRMDKMLLVPAGTIIDGRKVVYKAPNCFLARTASLKKVGYDENIHVIDHHDFFVRAAGQIVCVIDPDSYVMHCHNKFETQNYDIYRYNVAEDGRYIKRKHASKYQGRN